MPPPVMGSYDTGTEPGCQMGSRSRRAKGRGIDLALKGASRRLLARRVVEGPLRAGATAMAIAARWGRNCPVAPHLAADLCSQRLARALHPGLYQVLGQSEGFQAILAADRIGIVIEDGVDKRL
jgi:hypothetical protein